jgi:hypothetical protein
MVEYRAYTVGDDGHFVDYRSIVCRDDAEAIAQAKRLIDGRDVELWNLARFVIKLEAAPKRSTGGCRMEYAASEKLEEHKGDTAHYQGQPDQRQTEI